MVPVWKAVRAFGHKFRILWSPQTTLTTKNKKMTTRQEKTLIGTIEKRLVNKGTKSEHRGCILTTDDGEKHQIRYRDENSFELEYTSLFVGKRVEVAGFDIENSRLFIYTEIKELE